jgi:hypothetical protein
MVQLIRRFSASVALLCAAAFAITSLHWLLVGDASLMHYISFLIGRGRVPYRDIVDVNLPGTYAVEWIVIHLFGGGSLAWRLFDIALGLTAAVEMTFLAWPCDRLAGVLAGAVFFLIHGRDGMNELGQRDLVMTILLLASAAFFASALLRSGFAFSRSGFASHRYRLTFTALASACAGIAFTIKPTAALFWAAMLAYVLYSRAKTTRARLQNLVASVLSFLIAPAIALCFLLRVHALSSFWQTVTELIPLHNRLLRLPASYFLLHPLPSSLLPLLLLWLAVLAVRYRKNLDLFSSTETLIALAFLSGLVSFYLQRKALPYHRYPADAFFILLACLGFSRALQQRPPIPALKTLAATGLLFTALVVAPQCLLKTLPLSSSPNDFSQLLQKDLLTLGGPTLDHKVQCIDFTSGCITTLYRMGLEQSTGVLYDCYIFQPEDPVVRQYREKFWNALIGGTPGVIILSNQDCGRANSFDKIDRWPELANFITTKYTLYKEVHPPDPIHWASTVVPSNSYRIYLRRNAKPLPDIDQSLPSTFPESGAHRVP